MKATTWWRCLNCGAEGRHWMSEELIKDGMCPVALHTILMRELGKEPGEVCERSTLVTGCIPKLALVQ